MAANTKRSHGPPQPTSSSCCFVHPTGVKISGISEITFIWQQGLDFLFTVQAIVHEFKSPCHHDAQRQTEGQARMHKI
jgi:hypothetical protein